MVGGRGRGEAGRDRVSVRRIAGPVGARTMTLVAAAAAGAGSASILMADIYRDGSARAEEGAKEREIVSQSDRPREGRRVSSTR